MTATYAIPRDDAQQDTSSPDRLRVSRQFTAPTSVRFVLHTNLGETTVTTSRDSQHQDRIRRDFRNLANWWHDATDALSVTAMKMEHPAYRQILDELGQAAIGPILEDLRDRGGHWFHALSQLTGLPIAPFQARGDLQRVKDYWLTWGKTNYYIS